MFFGLCSCGTSSSSDDVIRTDRIVRKEKEETTPKKRDSLSGVMAKRSVASKRESRFDSADFFLEQKGEVPTRKPPAKPSLEDIVGEKNNQEAEEKKNNNNNREQTYQKPLAKTITEHLKSTEYLEWAEPDSPDKRKDLVGKKQRRGTLEALQDLGVSFNGDDSFSGPKTSRVREEEEKKKKKSSSRWTFFKRKKDS